MGNERFPKWLRERVDKLILDRATQGRGDHPTLVHDVTQLFLENCGNVIKFFRVVAGNYVSSRKQAMQRDRLICIGANGVAKLPQDMDANDIFAYFSRRSTMCVGDLSGTATVAHRYGNASLRDKCLQAMEALDPEAATKLKADLGLV